MVDITLPADAFSHGQIRSKIWLAERLRDWAPLHIPEAPLYTLNWYASWVGIGPFLLLLNSSLKFKHINLYDIFSANQKIAPYILDYWRCESVGISSFCNDIREITPSQVENQIFVNCACEHIPGDEWLARIPSGCFVLLQSTNMQHAEHLNLQQSLEGFKAAYSHLIEVLEGEQIEFDYPGRNFSRYMILGRRK